MDETPKTRFRNGSKGMPRDIDNNVKSSLASNFF